MPSMSAPASFVWLPREISRIDRKERRARSVIGKDDSLSLLFSVVITRVIYKASREGAKCNKVDQCSLFDHQVEYDNQFNYYSNSTHI